MDVNLINYTPNPERTIEYSARTCYNSVDKMTSDTSGELIFNKNSERLLKNLISKGHDSVLEHCSATFRLSGVSRTLLAQLTRHRLASYSVESQRYCDYSIQDTKDIFDENYFNKINSHDKAYFLGLLFSVGDICLDNNAVTLRLSLENKGLLYRLKNYIGCSIDENFGELRFVSKHVVDILVNNYGLDSNAARTGRVLKSIPKKYYSSFVLGVFDGSGSLEEERLFISSLSENLLKDLRYIKVFKDAEITNNNGVYCLQECNLDKISNILLWMYEKINISKDVFMIQKFANNIRRNEEFYNFYKNRINDENFVVPPEIIYNQEKLSAFYLACKTAQLNYFILRCSGVKKQDARFVLPSSTKTTIVITANLREWRHIVQLRGNLAAQWEIRFMAIEVLRHLKKIAPIVFDDFVIDGEHIKKIPFGK